MQRLENKICVITGAARGIGRAIAQAFVEQGANVVLTDIDAHEGTQVAAQLGARFIALDVADEAQWDALAAQVPACDVVVNNAGITGLGDHSHPHDPENTPLSEWRRVHQINIDGTFLGCRYAIRAMKAKGAGSIINMSSRSGLVGIPGAAAYASSKAAIRNHTKSVALYCANALASPARWPHCACCWPATRQPILPAASWILMAGCWQGRPPRQNRRGRKPPPSG